MNGLFQRVRDGVHSLEFRLTVAGLLFLILSGAATAHALGLQNPTVFVIVMVLAGCGWLTVARVLLWCIPGRALGWYDLTHFHYWPRLSSLLRWFYLYDNGSKAYGWLRIRDWWRLVRLGAGANRRWAGLLETIAYPFRSGDCILVGRLSWKRLPLFQPIGLPGGGKHVVIVGAPGSGKTLHIQTMLGSLHPDAACFVIDCDGAMVSALGAALEAAGHRVVKIDPDNLAKSYPGVGCWEPMDELTRADKRHGRSSVIAFGQRLAHALIIQDSEMQAHFANTARGFIKSLILYVWLFEKMKTLARLRALLTVGLREKVLDAEKDDPFEKLLNEMEALPARFANGDKEANDECNGELCAAIAAGAAGMHGRRGSKENPYRTVAVSQTAWLDDTNIRSVMGRSDFCGEDLKFTNTCVFIVATLGDIQTRLAPLMRAFTDLTMYAFERTPEKRLKIPTLFVLDECPSLGHIETLATAAPGFRKYGIRLLIVTQSIQLLRKTYPEEWRDFFSTAQCVLWMGLDDPGDTLKFLSEDMLGLSLRSERIKGTPWFAFWVSKASKAASRNQMIERPLMDPRQCGEALDPASGQIIVTRFGRRPMRLAQLVPFRDLPVWKIAVNPTYGERRIRAAFRGWLMKVKARLEANRSARARRAASA